MYLLRDGCTVLKIRPLIAARLLETDWKDAK
jgi:hypothetical protein